MIMLRGLVALIATVIVWVLTRRAVYGTPSDPTASTVITVAYAVANLLNPIRWLRTMTGGADPPGTGYVVTSDSTTATTWKTLAAVVQAGVGTVDLTLNNTIWLKVKESGGTARGAVRMDGSNNLILGDANNNAQIVSNALALPAATQINGNTAWHAGNDGAGSGLDSDLLDGQHGAYYATAASVTALAGVPSGLIALVTNAAAIPSGWARETALDGRIPVGDGTTDSVTFTAENNYGSSWSHTHTGPSHTHPASALGVSGNTGGPSALNGLGNGGGTSVPSTTHTHDQGSLDVTGNTDAGGTGNTGSTSHQPMMRAYVYVKKS